MTPVKRKPSKKKSPKKKEKKPATLAEQMATDAGNIQVSDESLNKISSLALRQVVLEDELAELEQKLKDKKDDLLRVAERELPDAMSEIGMEEFKLNDGTKIAVKRTFAGTITSKNQATAHKWLRVNGHGDLIKHTATVKFIKGQEEKAVALFKQLKKAGLVYTDKEAVNHQTLQAFVREQMTAVQEEGAEFPQELFNVFPVQKATVKRK